YFTYITTGTLIIFILLVIIQNGDSISITNLIQLLCASLVTAFITSFIISDKIEGPSKIKIVVHYIIICIVMTFLGISFEWVNFNLAGIILMVLSTAFVYVFTYAITYISSKCEADKINSALKNKNGH
ncbi:MAG: DUF3021 domain-containing protein, partial [Oscillospiraceae bacterium]|nr:DUF3021 domain-containing protein [Oscillospiraceae bacterium]